MKSVEQMTKAELVAELRRLNPFGGYSTSQPAAVLRKTVANYRRQK